MRNCKLNIILISFLVVLTSKASGQQSDTVGYVSLDPYYFHLKYITDSNSLLLDVREFFEYRRSRIKDAIHIPASGNMELVADTLDKEKSLFLYCYNDFRSRKAAEIFIKKGFLKVYSLEGGIVLWRKENMPVDKRNVRRPKE